MAVFVLAAGSAGAGFVTADLAIWWLPAGEAGRQVKSPFSCPQVGFAASELLVPFSQPPGFRCEVLFLGDEPLLPCGNLLGGPAGQKRRFRIIGSLDETTQLLDDQGDNRSPHR